MEPKGATGLIAGSPKPLVIAKPWTGAGWRWTRRPSKPAAGSDARVTRWVRA